MSKWILPAVVMLCMLARAPQALAQHEATPALEPGASATAHEAQGEAEHKPSLVPDPTSRETWFSALWVVVIFVILLVILYPTAWKGVLAGLEAREKRIRNDIAEAEAVRAKAEATLREYNTQLASAENKVKQMLASATADGERLGANLRLRAQQEVEEIKERATKDIEAAKNQAIGEIYQQAADLATLVAEKILRKNLNPADQRDLVQQSLEQLQSLNKN